MYHMVWFYATSPLPGGNFILLCRLHWECPEVTKYVLGYIVAGLEAGSVSVRYIFAALSFLWSSGSLRISYSLPAELVYTFMHFMASTLLPRSGTTSSQSFALAIDFVLIAGGYAGGGISEGAFNPAVAIGLVISSFVQRSHQYS